ncbi:DEAD/DEAH box helicase family protein [Candidatus Saccharibacteria bacterium]|nr:DEAD/DEAH box helicase family protein [Candidatus Saccharibacteria bacterium]
MPKNKIKVNEVLGDFLFNQIDNDPEFIEFADNYEIPDYITSNISRTLRPYQEAALKHFIFLYEKDRSLAKQLLFNMATGTGKTLVMACCILYLYQKGYRNFMFLVHQVQIETQAEQNFTNESFEKYYFNPKGIRINGKRIRVRKISKPDDAQRNAINIMFYSTQLLYSRLLADKENVITMESFEKNNIVVIADEAHRLNVDTRSKKKADQEEILNWESAVMKAIHAREGNMLLEFTATVDLKNENIRNKYLDKLVYRYDFLSFNKDGYSKDVRFLYNTETNIENQKRRLIINAVALSEFRKVFAERTMGVAINPIVMLKSTKIQKSEEDREFFNNVINSIRVEDLLKLKELSANSKHEHEHEILADMFRWLADVKNGFVKQGDTNDWNGLNSFLISIRQSFAPENTLIYNSQKKESPELLAKLDDPRNRIRAIFSVNALNEGWDVLSLYDIIHFDISANKQVSLQDIQLIGRGARYCPYKLPRTYKRDTGTLFSSMNMNRETDEYKRKFDNDPYDTARVLETFVYHFVKTGVFLENLQKDLLGEGIINQGIEKRTIRMKESFINSETYQKGFVLANRQIYRKKTTDEEIDATFNKVITASNYNLRATGMSDREQNELVSSLNTSEIKITPEFFSRHIIEKALMAAENGFFRFDNIRKHIVGIESVEDLINIYLPKFVIKYTYEEGKSISNLEPHEKLQLLIGTILPEVRKKIDLNMPRVIGDIKFRPKPLRSIFGNEKSIYLTAFPVVDPQTGEKKFITNDERSKAQTDNDKPELAYDIKNASWYAYDENYGTSEEKKFVKWCAGRIDKLHETYPEAEIYVIRNELDYCFWSPDTEHGNAGRRFFPDYLLIINDAKNKKMYYQCIIEPKGGHIIENDRWKEETLQYIHDNSKVSFDATSKDTKEESDFMKQIESEGYQEIKNIGVVFFNADNNDNLFRFADDFNKKLNLISE